MHNASDTWQNQCLTVRNLFFKDVSYHVDEKFTNHKSHVHTAAKSIEIKENMQEMMATKVHEATGNHWQVGTSLGRTMFLGVMSEIYLGPGEHESDDQRLEHA